MCRGPETETVTPHAAQTLAKRSNGRRCERLAPEGAGEARDSRRCLSRSPTVLGTGPRRLAHIRPGVIAFEHYYSGITFEHYYSTWPDLAPHLKARDKLVSMLDRP